jgi:hypothetical protein
MIGFSEMSNRARAVSASTTIVVASLAAIAIAGCGGSSSGAPQGASGASPGGAAPATLQIGPSPGGGVVAGASSARYGRASSAAKPGSAAALASHAPSHQFLVKATTPGVSEVTSPSKQNILNPCALVTRGEAQSILGSAVVPPKQAPMGPSCIYETANHKAFITLTVEARSFSALRAQKSLKPFFGVGRQAYCGGPNRATAMYVKVAPDEVLHLMAPCMTAGRFAAHALSRIGSAKGVVVAAAQ